MEFENQPAWSESFDRFYGYFAECFKREGTRRCAAVYWRGLLTEVERKNCWQLAEQMGEADPQPMQRLLYEAQWDEALMCQKLRGVVISQLGYAPGVGVIDESGFVLQDTLAV